MGDANGEGTSLLLDFPHLMVLGLLTIAGYYAGRLAKRFGLPSILGYMLVGLCVGPSAIHLLSHAELDGLSFINELALGFVAFTIGSELSIKAVRRQGRGLLWIILAECLGTFLVVLLFMALLTRVEDGASNWPLSLLFAAIASASAPAGTVAVIQDYKAKGSLTTALYAVVGFDDGLAILIFGFAYGIARVLLPGAEAGSVGLAELFLVPAEEVVLSLVVGGVLGVFFCFLARKLANTRDYLILVFGFILLGCGLSNHLGMSLILTNMVAGFVLVNTRSHDLVQRVADQMANVMPLLFILFFAVAGAHLDIFSLPHLGLIGVVYVAGRMLGKTGGAWTGATIGRCGPKLRRYLGWGLHTQAGVAIGLALIVKGDFDAISRELGEAGKQAAAEQVAWIGTTVITTITATCLFFEVAGPILAYLALKRAGEIPEDAE